MADVDSVLVLRQVEARCEVRAPLPAPKEGTLPLAADLDPARLSRKPSCVEDLNAVIPEGAPQLASLPRHPNVSMEEDLHHES